MYKIYIDNELIATSKLEKADAPMGVVGGKLIFIDNNFGYKNLKKYCVDNNIELSYDFPNDKMISTMSIPKLKIMNSNDVEIKGIGNQITGMDSEEYEIEIYGISYPFYEEEFPHHVQNYENRFNWDIKIGVTTGVKIKMTKRILIAIIILGCLNMQTKGQISIAKQTVYPSSEKVEFSITMRKEYYAAESNKIKRKFIWENKSNKTEKIMLKEGWEHLLMSGVSIKNEKNEELTKYQTKHILMSQIYQNKELKKHEIKLKPNEIKEYTCYLLSIPILKEGVLTEHNCLREGRYKIQAYYYAQKSNEIEIVIKQNKLINQKKE